MKLKFLSSIALVFLTGMQTVSAATFSDIGYSWYKDSIITLSDEKVISGFGDGTFGPEKSITRAEILKVIFLASGKDLSQVTEERCFPDVPTTMWYHPYICTAASEWIAKGFENGRFGPNDTVTTLEAIAFGLRAFGMSPPVPADGTPWYVPVQKLMNDNNIIPTHEYALDTKISRWKATELILRIRAYKNTQKVLSYESPGCSVATPTLGASNTIEIAGKTRQYLLYVPSNYSKDKQYSLIVASHGRTNSNAQVQAYMGLQWSRGGGGGRWSWGWGGYTATPSQDEFIVAYPAGLDAGGGSRSWSQAENITFFDGVIQQVSNTYCINRSNVFLVGHSLGGWFTHKLACLRGEVVHAMAGVGSAGYSAACTGQAASLLYQNVNDQLSSYANGVGGREIRKTVNGCKSETETVTIGSLSCQKWTDCTTGNPVVWCEWYSGLGGDPHSWPTWWGPAILDFFRGLRD